MNRLKQIDILRAFAVLLVLGRHMEPCPTEASAVLHQFTSIWHEGGWIGVDLFFVLSGFLVSGLLFREYEKYQELRIGRFLIRRGFKIYPPFWLLIGATVFVGIIGHQGLSKRGFACELLFLQNYGPGLWNHTWSLAVEEHFYLLLALAFFLLCRRRAAEPFRLIPAAFVVVASLCLLLRLYTCYHFPYKFKMHLCYTHLRLDGLFFGVLLAYGFHRNPVWFLSFGRRFKYLLAGIGVLTFIPAFYLPVDSTPWLRTFGLTLFYLGSGCFLMAALGAREPTTRVGTALAYAGSHSYSVYLWHMPVLFWGTSLLRRIVSDHYNWYFYALACFVGSVAFGIGMAVLTEFPVLRIRDRLFPSRGAPLPSDNTRPDNALQPPVTPQPVPATVISESGVAPS